jgi:hypothetical protein
MFTAGDDHRDIDDNDGTSEFAANKVAVLNQRPIAVTGADQTAQPKRPSRSTAAGQRW